MLVVTRRASLALVLCLAACGGPRGTPPQLAAPEAPAPPYRIQVGDVLGLRLFLTPELNEDVTVRPDGRVSTTLAESVQAAGRTPEQVAASLRATYARELRDPRLTVEVRTPSPVRIYVAGEVLGAGEFTTSGPPLTLVQAVAKAGGLRTTGDPDAIVIVRHGEGEQPMVLKARYLAAVNGSDPTADIALQPFDIVYVPKTGIARVYLWVNQHLQQFVPVNWGFSYNVNPIVGK
jgi:polysaccharide export outer membrane protein